MITSKQILNLSEDWFKRVKWNNVNVNIYVNPTSSDIVDLYKSIKDKDKQIRFIVNAKAQKIYVWDALAMIHESVYPELGLSFLPGSVPKPYTMFGYGYISGGKIVAYTSDNFPGTLKRLVDGPVMIDNKRLLDSSIRYVIKHEIDYLSEKFDYSWAFVDRFISGGLGQYIETQKRRFFDWRKIHNDV